VNTYFIDTETCGLHGVPVLIQYAMDDGPVCIHHIWTEPIHTTLNLIQRFVDGRVVAHNLRFDWFHLQKIYNTLRLLREHAYAPKYHDIQTIVDAEYASRNGHCLKPMAAICTMLLAQKGEFQSRPAWQVSGQGQEYYVSEAGAAYPIEMMIFECPGSERLWSLVLAADRESYVGHLRAVQETFECPPGNSN